MGEKSKTKKTLVKRVQFEFLAPKATQVYLAGDFNNWDTISNPMKKDGKGLWP
jgi:1,4-alpha-glucan branching enzyme